MRRLSILIVLAIALLSLVSVVQAGQIEGSLSWVGSGVTENVPGNLAGSDLFTLTKLIKVSGLGDFVLTPPDFTLLVAPVSVDTTTPATLAAFTFSDAAFGTWVTTSGSHTHSIVGGAPFLNIALTGTFTPGTLYPGLTANFGNFNISLNEAGSSLSAGGTLSLPKAVPEASTLVGFGSALLMSGPGLIGWLRKRRA